MITEKQIWMDLIAKIVMKSTQKLVVIMMTMTLQHIRCAAHARVNIFKWIQ